MDPSGKGKSKWIKKKREKMCGSKGKENRCVDPSGKRKSVWIQGKRLEVSGSKRKEKR